MKLIDQLVIGVICVILGFFIAVQFKTVQANYLDGLLPNQRSAQLVSELKKLRADKDNLAAQVDQLQGDLNAITEAASNESAILKNLQDQVERYKALSGYTELVGQGIVFTIDNPPVDFNSLYPLSIVDEYQQLLAVVNELNAAGAEAVAINDQRIIAMSEIRAAGNYLSVNTQQYKPPFTIKAIGNKSVLEAALLQRFGIVPALQERGYQVDVKAHDAVLIPKFNAIINWQYAGPKE